MATCTADRIPLLILLFSSALVLLSTTAPCQAQPVLDADGDPVLVGALYRLNYGGDGLAVGGVTTLQPANTTACVNHIGPGEETDPGLPVLITPGSPFLAPDGILKESIRSRISIQTPTPSACAYQAIWSVALASSSWHGPFTAVVTGLQAGSGPLPRSEWFEVRKADQLERAYKLIYCPVCLTCEAFCLAEVGGYVVENNVALGVGNLLARAPLEFPVRFVKYWPRTAAAATPIGSS